VRLKNRVDLLQLRRELGWRKAEGGLVPHKVVAHLVPLGSDVAQQLGMLEGMLPDDEESGLHLER
jgi:hypothetical protein